MKNNKLEVGDEVYRERSSWTNRNNYEILKVNRVTKTTAILSDNTKLKIESKSKRWAVIPHRRYTYYELLTEEIKTKITENNIFYTKISWFDKKQFTNEEKAIIYDLLNK